MVEILSFLAEKLWAMPLIFLILATSLYFTFRMKFPQITQFREMSRLLKIRGASQEGLSPFQSFIFTAARSIGVGNLAGMAAGIYFGGPGAIFWLWFLAFFGSSIAIIEGTLAQTYKEIVNNEFKGGPANYMAKGIKNKKIGKIFALLYSFITFISLTFLMSGVQSFYIVQGLKEAFHINGLFMGLALTVLLATVIFGGLKRMGQAAQKISPTIGLIYVTMSILIIILNIQKFPSTIVLIIKSAFGSDAIFGAILSSALQWGIRRGVHANEVGIGTSAVTSATSTVSHPVQQGLLGGMSVFIGTLFVCTTTTFMILMTNSYNVISPSGSKLIFEGVKGLEYGNPFISHAIQKTIPLPNFGNIFVALAILFFAFIALTAFYLYAESNLAYIVGQKKIFYFLLKIGFLCAVFIGTIVASDAIWAMADIGNALMAWINIIALIIVGNKGILIYNDYIQQKAEGILNPVFHPDRLGLKVDKRIWDSTCSDQKK